MRRFVLFGLLWPLLFLLCVAFTTPPTQPVLTHRQFATGMASLYIWMIFPALLIAAFDLLGSRVRYGLGAVTALVGVIGLALSHWIPGMALASIPTFICGRMSRLIDAERRKSC